MGGDGSGDISRQVKSETQRLGKLFRSALPRAFDARGIHANIVLERYAPPAIAAGLLKSMSDVRSTVQDPRRTIEGSWGVEQKLAAAGGSLVRC